MGYVLNITIILLFHPEMDGVFFNFNVTKTAITANKISVKNNKNSL